MSYYSTLSPSQLSIRLAAFNAAFSKEDMNYFVNPSIHSLSKEEFNLVLDHIGYSIFRALCMSRKYQLQKMSLLKYIPYYHEADYMSACLLTAFPLETIQSYNANAYNMLKRFLKVDSF